MNKAEKEAWVQWFRQQTDEDKDAIAISAIERLIETEEVSFRSPDSHDTDCVQCLYWTSCGEDLRIPF